MTSITMVLWFIAAGITTGLIFRILLYAGSWVRIEWLRRRDDLILDAIEIGVSNAMSMRQKYLTQTQGKLTEDHKTALRTLALLEAEGVLQHTGIRLNAVGQNALSAMVRRIVDARTQEIAQ